MESFDFQPRTRVIFGAGSIERLGQVARELNFRHTLLVADRGLVDAQPRAGAGIGALVPHGRDDAQVVPIHRVGLITRLA